MCARSQRNPVLVLRLSRRQSHGPARPRRPRHCSTSRTRSPGHAAYDLVSLLQTPRDVLAALEEAMIGALREGRPNVADRELFRAHYEILGAQRNTKILGIFTRLWKRDGKQHYLPLQPRVWGYLERNLAHPALAPVRAWFEAHVPAAKRAAAWGEAA
jgi:aminoglycoside/choline kinase family phosphotransferase